MKNVKNFRIEVDSNKRYNNQNIKLVVLEQTIPDKQTKINRVFISFISYLIIVAFDRQIK